MRNSRTGGGRLHDAADKCNLAAGALEDAAVKHATAAALDRLEPLLADLRELPGLKEKSRGVFYRKSSAFLHFHEDAAGLFADIRAANGEFDRCRVETDDERAMFIVIARSS
jgi:hypothetical protein